MLFVRLRDGLTLDARSSRNASARRIRANTIAAPCPGADRPGAGRAAHASGKIVELAVRDVVHGRPVRNREALANPDALDAFRDRPELLD